MCQNSKENNSKDIIEIGGAIRKMREWPSGGGGSLTLAQFIAYDELNEIKDRVLNILYQQGYRGQYDIEFLVCKDKIYLNEINFRHSGNGYGLIENGVSAPYIWCLDCAGMSLQDDVKTQVSAGTFHMDELSDFSHRKGNNVTWRQWLKDIRNTKAFAVFNWSDLSGTWGFYGAKLNKVLRRVFKF